MSKQPVTNTGWLPSHMQIRLMLEYVTGEAGTVSVGSFDFAFQLYLDDEETRPIWLVHPEQRSRVDVAAIALSDLAKYPVVIDAANRDDTLDIIEHLDAATEMQALKSGRSGRLVAHERPDFEARLEITDDVFVVGYPEAIAAGHGTPIWKRGSVASEPELPLQNRPCFLIDSATRPGLSGSPAVARFKNPTWDNGGKGKLTLVGDRLGFAGLYTSRLGRDADGAQLGIVWTTAAIEAVVSGRFVGRPASDFSGLCDEGVGDPIV